LFKPILNLFNSFNKFSIKSTVNQYIEMITKKNKNKKHADILGFGSAIGNTIAMWSIHGKIVYSKTTYLHNYMT
jgi:hypothetical protein